MMDMSEAPLDFPLPPLHAAEKVAKLTGRQKRAFRAAGVRIKEGPWTRREVSTLNRNLDRFRQRFHYTGDTGRLLGVDRRHRHRTTVRWAKAKHFYARLAKGLKDRPLYQVYKKARGCFGRPEARLCEEEVAWLKELREQEGPRWERIGRALENPFAGGRSGDSARSAFRWHKEEVTKGKWCPQEDGLLAAALRRVTGKRDLSRASREIEAVSWERVADKVPGRNQDQCRHRWHEQLAWRRVSEGRRRWSKDDFYRLACVLEERGGNDIHTIDWAEVQSCFGDLATTKQYLRTKYYYLRNRLPPNIRSNLRRMVSIWKEWYAPKEE